MLKRNVKANICRLCLNTKCDVDFEVVEVIKEVLEIAWPKLNLEEGDKYLICNSCSGKLFVAFDFKSVCTDTEDTIFPYVNSQETPLADLREIYLKEKRDVQLIDILEYQKICRLCFQSVGYGFVSSNEVDADIINNYIPEVNFNATKDPVICKLCSDSLVTHGNFISSCLAAQEQNRNVCGELAEDIECCIKTEEIKIEDDWERKVCGILAEDSECCIKIEEIKIEDDCDSYPPTRLENVETIKNFDDRFSSENKPVEYKKHLLQKVRTYKCNRCDFKTMYKCSLKVHCLKHKVSLTPTYISPKSQCKSENRGASLPCTLKRHERMYQCEKCPYRTHLRDTFARHWSTHEVPPDVKVYQCDKCYYRVTQKSHFHSHQLKHQDGGIVEKYTCDKCDFQTRYKSNLVTHQLLHKKKMWKDVKCYTEDDGKLMYKCNVCKYKTKDKSQSLVHQSRHVSPTKEPKFKCHTCAFESVNKGSLTRHQLTHSSEAKTYKCGVCFFQTIWRYNFIRHQLSKRH